MKYVFTRCSFLRIKKGADIVANGKQQIINLLGRSLASSNTGNVRIRSVLPHILLKTVF